MKQSQYLKSHVTKHITIKYQQCITIIQKDPTEHQFKSYVKDISQYITLFKRDIQGN